jgi:hypothetical protein
MRPKTDHIKYKDLTCILIIIKSNLTSQKCTISKKIINNVKSKNNSSEDEYVE